MPLQEYAKKQLPKYDIILSNPPFFLSSLKSADAAKNTAKHTGELLFEDILYIAQQHLTVQGKLYLLLPPAEALYFAGLAKASDLYLSEVLRVHTYHGGKCIRHIQTYTFSVVAAPVTKDFYIREADKTNYTSEFRQLLQPYYLAL
jgi:tRNA1Val (adenine37-N6)-methyltransferase